MQPDGPYQLLEVVGSWPAGKVWSAVDAFGQSLTVAVLDEALATDQRWRDAFAATANALSSREGGPSYRHADFTVPAPWVAFAAGDGRGAEQIFVALATSDRLDASQWRTGGFPSDLASPHSASVPAGSATIGPVPPTMGGPQPLLFQYVPEPPPFTRIEPPRWRIALWFVQQIGLLVGRRISLWVSRPTGLRVGIAVAVIVVLGAVGGLFAARLGDGAPVASAWSDPPSPQPSASPSDNRPSERNTGAPEGTKLRVVEGDRTFGKNGQVYSGLDIRGNVRITGSNITLRRSIIRGAGRMKGDQCTTAAVISIDGGSNVTIEDVEAYGASPNACLDGIWAKNATLTRVNIHRVVDGVKAYDNVLIQDSYIHSLISFPSDPAQNGGPTHNDGVQTWEGNRNITIRRNTITLSRGHNAAYQVNQTRGLPATDIRVLDNWLDSGGCTLNFTQGAGPPITGIFVVNNRFGPTTQCPIFLNGATLSANKGNVWDETGAPIPPPRRAA
jgi:hypothetical protein